MIDIQKINKFKSKIIVEKKSCNIDEIFPHELILKERSSGLEAYLKSLSPWILVPSILVCKTSNVIIDGHHRYYILKKLNYKDIPITTIDYSSDNIITHNDKKKALTKPQIINSALSKNLLKPKSSLHHLLIDKILIPIMVLSDFRVMN